MRRINVHPVVIGAVLASMPRKVSERDRLLALYAVVGYSLALALVVGGVGAIFALLGV